MVNPAPKSNQAKMQAIEEIHRNFLDQLDQLKGRRLKITASSQKCQDQEKIDHLRSQLKK